MYNKGVDNLSPPFGKFRFAASHLGKVILGILCIGKYQNHIFDRKIPLLFALNPYCPDFLVLKQLYFLYIRHNNIFRHYKNNDLLRAVQIVMKLIILKEEEYCHNIVARKSRAKQITTAHKER